MSTGRIDVIATPSDSGIYVSIDSLDRVVTLKGDGMSGFVWNADLTREEARYLADELGAALAVNGEGR